MFEITPAPTTRMRPVSRDPWDRLLWPMVSGAAAPEATVFEPSVDLTETEDAYQLTAEMPGMDPQDIELEIRDNLLVLKGEKKQESESSQAGMHMKERTYGSFTRTFRLPQGIDREQVEATHKNGLLRVNLPKDGGSPGRRVEVKPG